MNDEIALKIERIVGQNLAPFRGRRLLAGVSGGADSVALLVAMSACGCDTLCVHCNFHLRGEESMRDQLFVEALCEELRVPLRVVSFNVEDYRREHSVSVEMACRELRYAEFEKIMREEEAARVAIAHNSDDNAETLLLNLFRGTGVAGLRGMVADNGVALRPLLGISRKEIEEYLKAKNIGYIVDSTNLESDYKRNFIRNEVLPLIETRWPEVRRTLNRTAGIMMQEERALQELESHFAIEENLLPWKSIESSCNPDWLIRRFAVKHGGSNDISAEMAVSVVKGRQSQGKHWKSEEGEFVVSAHGLEFIGREERKISTASDFEITECENTPELMRKIREGKDNRTLWIAVEKEKIELRPWQAGDRIRPLGMRGSRLVSDIIREARLSAKEKREICVAVHAETREVLWVEGLKRSSSYLIRPENKIICKIVRKIEIL